MIRPVPTRELAAKLVLLCRRFGRTHIPETLVWPRSQIPTTAGSSDARNPRPVVCFQTGQERDTAVSSRCRSNKIPLPSQVSLPLPVYMNFSCLVKIFLYAASRYTL